MSERISDRHEGQLGGRFLPFGDTNRVGVTIVLPANAAHTAGAQHLTWMLLNLLSRQEGIVQTIGLICPDGIRLSGRIVPIADRSLDLKGALIAGSAEIGIVPLVQHEVVGRKLVIGSEFVSGADLYVMADGWAGGISTSSTNDRLFQSSLSIGPYIAACLAAGEVFKAARLNSESYVSPSSVFYSAWSNDVSSTLDSSGPPQVQVAIDFTLAGVGAVGCAAVHTLWSSDGIQGQLSIADNDARGLEASNLNRYALFGKSSLAKPKASEASRIVTDATWNCVAHDNSVEQLAPFPNYVGSAVDRNRSRAAIQNKYPAQLLSASTKDLRAEVLRCGPPGVGACLRCFNPPEQALPDGIVRETILGLADSDLIPLAANAGVTPDEARTWARTGLCGIAGEKVLAQVRNANEGPAEFAVGFVSVMAGVMLASEIIKDELLGVAGIRDELNRSVFQFWSPAASINRPSMLLRDPNCPMCGPSIPATQIWAKRVSALMRNSDQ